MKPLLTLPHIAWSLLLLPVLAPAQGVPSTAGSSAPSTVAGGGGGGITSAADVLTYNISASNSIITGYSGANGFSDSVNIAGNASYVSGSERHPTSFVYSGGYLFGNSGQPSSTFQNIGVSQVLNTRTWTFVVSDVFSFLPSTPRYGLAGIPGVGDTGSLPIATGQLSNDAVLTNYGQRVSNSASGSASYRFSARTNVDLFAGYTLQRFLNGASASTALVNNGFGTGINNNSLSAGAQLNHRLTAATTIGGAYTYSHSSYPSPYNFSFTSNALLATYQHTFSPKLAMQASVGPQWTSGSDSRLVPTRLGVAAGLNVTYVAGRTNYGIGYNRGTNAGSGVLLGATTDYVNFSGQRRFTERWAGGAFLGFGRAQSLSNDPALYSSTNSFTAGLQANRSIGEHFSAFSSYAMQYQTVSRLIATNNAFDGVAHIISFGVTYTPRPIHLGRR